MSDRGLVPPSKPSGNSRGTMCSSKGQLFSGISKLAHSLCCARRPARRTRATALCPKSRGTGGSATRARPASTASRGAVGPPQGCTAPSARCTPSLRFTACAHPWMLAQFPVSSRNPAVKFTAVSHQGGQRGAIHGAAHSARVRTLEQLLQRALGRVAHPKVAAPAVTGAGGPPVARLREGPRRLASAAQVEGARTGHRPVGIVPQGAKVTMKDGGDGMELGCALLGSLK